MKKHCTGSSLIHAFLALIAIAAIPFVARAEAKVSNQLSIPASHPNCQLLKEYTRLKVEDQKVEYRDRLAAYRDGKPVPSAIAVEKALKAHEQEAHKQLLKEFQARNQFTIKKVHKKATKSKSAHVYVETSVAELESEIVCEIDVNFYGGQRSFNLLSYPLIGLQAKCSHGPLKAEFAEITYSCDIRTLADELEYEYKSNQRQ